MPDISVPWGSGELGISLPQQWTIQQVAAPSLREAPEDWSDRLAVAINRPGGGAPLSNLLNIHRNGRIVLIVEDLTRHSPLPKILDIVMREVHHASIAPDRLEIFFATGMHPPLTDVQAAEKLGAPGENLRWRCNPWSDESAYESVGQVGRMDVSIDRKIAQADLRIVISSVSPHLQAGFGGGYKMFLPGCASLETIRNLHRLGIGRTARQLVGTDRRHNPMRAAIDAAGRLIDQHAGQTFAVQYLLDENDLPTSIATGEMISTQRMLAKHCAVGCGVLTTTPADVLITNAHPRDYDLWQSFKCIPNTLWAARPNGVIICLARCEGGAEGMEVPRWSIRPSWVRRLVRLIGPNGICSLLTRAAPQLAGDAAFFVRLALQTIHRNHVFMVSPALVRAGATFPGLQIFETVDEAITVAQRILGAGPQRVILFPSGGTTFPIVAPSPVQHAGN